MDQVRLAVIGCGRVPSGWARVHLSTVGGRDAGTGDELRPFAERVQVRACADIDLAKARVDSQEIGREAASGLGNFLPTFARCILRDELVPATVRDGARAGTHKVGGRFILKCFESARTGEIARF